MELFFGLFIFVVILIVLDLAALAWGADSRDDVCSGEWARREQRGSIY